MTRGIRLAVVIGMVGSLSLAVPADACLNELLLTQDEAVKRIAQIEFHLRHEQYWLAHQAIPSVLDFEDPELSDHMITRSIRIRMRDAEALLQLRWHRAERWQDLAAYRRGANEAALWFFQRVWDDPDSPQLLAWLAEANEATGDTGRARDILRDLERRDLMPDAFAYATLASVSGGEEWAAARARCKLRAEVASICVVRSAH